RRRAHRAAHGREGTQPRGARHLRARAGARRGIPRRPLVPRALLRALPQARVARGAFFVVDDLDAASLRRRRSVPGAPAARAARVRHGLARGRHEHGGELRGIAVRGAQPVTEADRPNVVAFPGVVYAIAFAAAYGLQLAWPLPFAPAPVARWAGIVLGVGGAILIAWGVASMRRARTNIYPSLPATALV